MKDEMEAIRATVQTYLDGLYEGDVTKLNLTFHSTSTLTSEENGVLKTESRNMWFERIRDRQSPKLSELERSDEILSIDQASPAMAFVKLKCAIPPRFFTDYLSLLKVEGRWQIVQKVFITELCGSA